MSKTKRFLEDQIATLAKRNGYDYIFLMERFIETVLLDDCSFDQFVGITNERDW